MSGEGGISMGEVQSAINSAVSSVRSELRSEIRDVHSELKSEIRALESFVNKEIQRLEAEMREIGEKIVHAIQIQTAAVVGGVAATTLMIERTKSQIETDFEQTRSTLALQTESTLQIEIGKKLAEANSSKGKLEAFFSDIKSRFDKSVEGIALNRQLYDLNFSKILSEYQNKIETIGEHIFQIRTEDVAPAIKAARVPYEEAHSLPVETDLKRLSVRSENLDQALSFLKSNRLDDVLSSIDTLEVTLEAAFALEQGGTPLPANSLFVEGIVTDSSITSEIIVGVQAQTVTNEMPVNMVHSDSGLVMYRDKHVEGSLSKALRAQPGTDPSSDDVVALFKAAKALRGRNMISQPALALLEDFLGSGSLKYVEANNVG